MFSYVQGYQLRNNKPLIKCVLTLLKNYEPNSYLRRIVYV